MTKKSMCILVVSFFAALVFAYNPPVYGENLYDFVSPEALSLGDSVTGGGIKSVALEDIAVNPALIAGEQRFTMKLSGSLLLQNAYEAEANGFTQKQKGGAAQFGMIFPSRVGVAATSFQFVTGSAEADNSCGPINYGKNFTLRAAFAKDLIDDLYLGLGMYGSFGDDWAVAGDLGLWCNIHTVKWLPFMKDIRWAAALTGMGKAYKTSTGLYSENATGIPSPFTFRFGFAGTLLDVKNFISGISMDIALPSFQNIIFSTSLDLLFFNMINLRAGWEINAREVAATKIVMIPSASLSVKFNFTASKKDDSFISKQGWAQSEMDIAGGYRYFESGIHGIAAGVTLRTGQKDVEAPVINLWEE